MIVPNSPDFRWECIATMTFSEAVMRPNSRMFWKVRPIPRAAIECGAWPVMSSSPSSTCPDDGL